MRGLDWCSVSAIAALKTYFSRLFTRIITSVSYKTRKQKHAHYTAHTSILCYQSLEMQTFQEHENLSGPTSWFWYYSTISSSSTFVLYTLVATGHMLLFKLKLKHQFLICTSQFSGVQNSHVASGYQGGQRGQTAFPKLQDVLLDGLLSRPGESTLTFPEIYSDNFPYEFLFPCLCKYLCIILFGCR